VAVGALPSLPSGSPTMTQTTFREMAAITTSSYPPGGIDLYPMPHKNYTTGMDSGRHMHDTEATQTATQNTEQC